MLIVDTAADLAAHIGQRLEPSPWLEITQASIDAFAALSGDRQWIHVDAERAARELPGGRTIAHGYLLLGLMGTLQMSVYRITQKARAVNYGLDRVRFLRPVPAGAEVRLNLVFKSVEPSGKGTRITAHAELELNGQEGPALAADTILMSY